MMYVLEITLKPIPCLPLCSNPFGIKEYIQRRTGRLILFKCLQKLVLNTYWFLRTCSPDGLRHLPHEQKRQCRYASTCWRRLFLDLDFLSPSRVTVVYPLQLLIQGIASALGLQYKLHSPCHPQSSEKVKRMNNMHHKENADKAMSGNSGALDKVTPCSLAPIWSALRASLKLSPYEMIHGRPFLSNDILVDDDTNWILQYVIESITSSHYRIWE